MEIRSEIKNFLKSFDSSKYSISEQADRLTIYFYNEPKKAQFDFEKLYASYPLKRGKAKGMEKLRKVVKTQGDYDNYERAISNYNIYLRNSGSKFIQHFSTFINGGWEDFLDEQSIGNNPLEDDYLKLLESIDLHLKFKDHLKELKVRFKSFENFKEYLSKQKQFFDSHSSSVENPERFRSIVSKLLLGEIGVRVW